MQKIYPHLWFDTQAREAAEFYTKVFENSKITKINTLHDTPSGDADVVTVSLSGQKFMFLSAGPYFTFNPSVSFLIACTSVAEVDKLWKQLAEGGQALMELGEYPFSKRYGWTTDTYGVSWQIMLMGERPFAQKITPTMMFVGKQCGRAEEAMKLYTSIFKNSAMQVDMRYEAGESPDKPGTIKHASFTLEGQHFAAMDSAYEHKFQFNEAISFVVSCDTQAEIDHYWQALSADPAAEQCGWLKDKFGFSWQIVPAMMDRMFAEGDPASLARVTQAFLKMKKFNLAELEAAYRGKS